MKFNIFSGYVKNSVCHVKLANTCLGLKLCFVLMTLVAKYTVPVELEESLLFYYYSAINCSAKAPVVDKVPNPIT